MIVNTNYPVVSVVSSSASSEFYTFTNGLCHSTRDYHELRYFPNTATINNLSVLFTIRDSTIYLLPGETKLVTMHDTKATEKKDSAR
jgi:hypothetical protein